MVYGLWWLALIAVLVWRRQWQTRRNEANVQNEDTASPLRLRPVKYIHSVAHYKKRLQRSAQSGLFKAVFFRSQKNVFVFFVNRLN